MALIENSVISPMSDRDSGTPWLDVQGAAARALCSDATILREARAGRLTGYKIGGRRCWRFLADDVDAWLKVGPVKYAPRLHDVKPKALFMTVWRPSTRSAENSCGMRQG